MDSVTRGADRQSLMRDLDRLLDKYSDLSLQELSAQEVFDDVLPVAFRHRVRLPPQLWLLGKTLVMMEGLGVKLDPDFQILEASRPYVALLAEKVASPRALLSQASDDLTHGVELLRAVLEIVPRLLDKADSGKLEVRAHIPELPKAVRGLDRIANRLAVSMLVSAFIVAMALLLPVFAPQALLGLGGWVILLGFLVASVMGLWLLYQVLRSGR
jgi:ubiquinone biosynthesis protein